MEDRGSGTPADVSGLGARKKKMALTCFVLDGCGGSLRGSHWTGCRDGGRHHDVRRTIWQELHGMYLA